MPQREDRLDSAPLIERSFRDLRKSDDLHRCREATFEQLPLGIVEESGVDIPVSGYVYELLGRQCRVERLTYGPGRLGTRLHHLVNVSLDIQDGPAPLFPEPVLYDSGDDYGQYSDRQDRYERNIYAPDYVSVIIIHLEF